MKKVIFLVLLPFLLFAQSRYYFPMPIEASNGRPYSSSVSVIAYPTGTTSNGLTLTKGSGSQYYYDDSEPTSQAYDIYVNGVLHLTKVWWITGETAIADGIVTTSKLADSSITSAKIADNGILASNIYQYDVLNIMDYGAERDSTQEDSTEMANLIADITNGAVIVLPQGNYLMYELSFSNLDNITIDGRGSTIYTDTTALGNSKGLFTFNNCNNIKLTNFTIDGFWGTETGNTSENPGKSVSMVHVKNSDNITIDNIIFRHWVTGSNTSQGWLDPCAVRIDTSSRILIQNSKFYYTMREGILTQGCTDITYNNLYFDHVGWTPIHTVDGDIVKMTRVVTRNTGIADGFNGSMITAGATSFSIENCDFQYHGSDFSSPLANSGWGAQGIYIHNYTSPVNISLKVKNSIFKNMKYALLNGAYQSGTVSVKELEFSGNTIDSVYEGIASLDFDNVKISDNTITNATRGIQNNLTASDTLYNWVISGNNFRDIAGSSIIVWGSSGTVTFKNFKINDNSSFNCAPSGTVYNLRDADDMIVRGNTSIYSSGTAPLYHYYLSNDDAYLYIFDNLAVGSASVANYLITGANSAKRVIGLNKGYGTTSFTWDVPSLDSLGVALDTVAVAGSFLGDIIYVNPGLDCAGIQFTAYVGTTGNVVVRAFNPGGNGTVDLASATFYLRFIDKDF